MTEQNTAHTDSAGSKLRAPNTRLSQRNVITLLCITSLSLIVLVTQNWVTVQLDPTGSAITEIAVNGAGMHPVLLPAAIAMLVASLVILIAGRVFKYLLALIVIALATVIIFASTAQLTDPVAAVATRIGDATGITGAGQAELVTDYGISGLVWVTIAVAVIGQLLGAVVLFSAHRWKSSRKYDVAAAAGGANGGTGAVSTDEVANPMVITGGADVSVADTDSILDSDIDFTDEAVDNDARISDWDELSRGNDPSAK